MEEGLMAKLIDGKAIREQELDRLGRRVAELKSDGISPSLAVIIVGSDPASRIYVNNKKATCERTGIISIEHALPEETTTAELLELIDSLNADPAVNRARAHIARKGCRLLPPGECRQALDRQRSPCTLHSYGHGHNAGA